MNTIRKPTKTTMNERESFWTRLLNFFKQKRNKSIDDFFQREKIPAENAYLISKYGEITTKEELLKEFFKNARDLIYIKSENKQFSAILELSEDIQEYLPKIVDHYKEYGYNVIVIDPSTEIKNEYNSKSSRITMTLIVLTWNEIPKNNKNNE